MPTSPSVTITASRARLLSAAWLVAALGAGSAQAQSASSTVSSYRIGYGGAGVAGLESPVNLSLISTSSQFAVSDGVNSAGAVGSVFATQPSGSQTVGSQASGGAGQSYSGVGQPAVSNARAPVAVMDGSSFNVANARGAATTPAAQSSTTAPPASPMTGAATAGTTPSEMVLNGNVNLDGGQ